MTAAPATGRIADDKAMLRAAAELTRDLVQPRPRLYWADLIASAVVGYGALVMAIMSTSTALSVVALMALVALFFTGAVPTVQAADEKAQAPADG